MNANYMKRAAREALDGMRSGEGGPFGAVVVRGGELISCAHNTVVAAKDPTAHAEINAIRAAAAKLGRFDLSDCELYTSCEPCPMCFAAAHWAKIRRVYYGCTADDAAEAGFDDRYIYDVIRGTASERHVEVEQTGREDCLPAFDEWKRKRDKTQY